MTGNLNKGSAKELIRIFIRESERKRKRLMNALLRCAAAEDQHPAATLRSAIDSISNTIAALRSEARTLSDLKRYHLLVMLPVLEEEPEAQVTVEITQKPISHPLPPFHYIEVKSPVGKPARTPIIKNRGDPFHTYLHTFNLGERSAEHIESVRSSDVEFRLFRKNTGFSQHPVRDTLVGLATAPLAALSYELSTTAPLHFMAMDGKRSSFIFEVRMTVVAPLVSKEELTVNETIDVIPV
jgi:hypothetical protein